MSQGPSLSLQNFFKQSPEIPLNSKWDTLWQNSCTPWDRGRPSPALEELLVDKHFPLISNGKPGKALVPGCGRGYDVVLLAGLTAPDQKLEKVVGLDVSPKAVEEAKTLHKDAQGHSEFIVGDFFSETEDWAKSGLYDVVYDYTFLCALHPDMRSKWAKRMAETITPKTGLLIALQHPLDKSLFHAEDPNRGPPFLLSPEIYDSLLQDNFERVYFEQPNKSHEVGTTDKMSVWRRR